MLRKILAIISLIGLITIGLLAYSVTTSVSEMQQKSTAYQQDVKQQLISKTKEAAAPILSKFGVDIEKVDSTDLNIVKKKLEDASSAVNDASKKTIGSQ